MSPSITLTAALFFFVGSLAHNTCVPKIGSPKGSICSTQYGINDSEAYGAGSISGGLLDVSYTDSGDACLVKCQQTPSCETVVFLQGELCQLLSVAPSELAMTQNAGALKIYEVACLVRCSSSTPSTSTSSISTQRYPTHPSKSKCRAKKTTISTSSSRATSKTRHHRSHTTEHKYSTKTTSSVPTSTSTSTSSSSTSSPPVTSSPSNSTSCVQLTTSTVFTTVVSPVTQCASTVTNCSPHSTYLVTSTIALYATVYPVAATATPRAVYPNAPEYTTSVVYTTELVTVTACPASVFNCLRTRRPRP